jgi:hypothetical protein
MHQQKQPKGKEVTAFANASEKTVTSKPTDDSSSTTHQQDLSLAMIEALPNESSPTAENLTCIAQQTLSSILDSGTTSTLVMDHSLFWTFLEDTSVTVTTANHGKLMTSGRGECIADLTINSKTHHIHLSNCLHAPGALVIL